jgi:hypothetical protein
MSDQANNLRQLVRAHRLWRELLGQPVLEPKAQNGPAPDEAGRRREDHAETNGVGSAGLVARTRDWARAWRLRKAGGKKGDPA